MTRLQIKLFGPLEVLVEGRSISVGGPKQQALLGYLVFGAGVAHGREDLMRLLWPDRSSDNARHALRQALRRLRIALREGNVDPIKTESDCLRFDADRISVDVLRFRTLVQNNDVESLESACGLFGELMQGLATKQHEFDEWLTAERQVLRRQYGNALSRLSGQLVEHGQVAAALRAAETWAALDTLSEEAVRQVMVCRHAGGDPSGALDTFRQHQRLIRQELDAVPAAETSELAEAIRTGRLSGTSKPRTSGGSLSSRSGGTLATRPSVAILPFDNMSTDPHQDYFADGIVEDLITALSQFRSLLVIARNTTFTYKDRTVDIARVAEELNVRYVVEGSVRRAGDRVRITAQLIDSSDGAHLWADRFDGTLEDVFALQDRVTERIVVGIEPEIAARERDRAHRKPPEVLDAWELVHRGTSHLYNLAKADTDKAIELFKQAIALDPGFAVAHAHLAYAFTQGLVGAYADDKVQVLREARDAAQMALVLDQNDALAHLASGRMSVLEGDTDTAIRELETAIALNPNLAIAHHNLGMAYFYGAAESERSLIHFDEALRLSPRDPMRWQPLTNKCSALKALGRFEEAVAVGREACRVPGGGHQPYMRLAGALVEAGQIDEAKVAIDRAREIQPVLSISFLRKNFPGGHRAILESFLSSMRKAGLPE